jgi:hypothetical protein
MLPSPYRTTTNLWGIAEREQPRAPHWYVKEQAYTAPRLEFTDPCLHSWYRYVDEEIDELRARLRTLPQSSYDAGLVQITIDMLCLRRAHGKPEKEPVDWMKTPTVKQVYNLIEDWGGMGIF